jgi:hypothetical protein
MQEMWGIVSNFFQSDITLANVSAIINTAIVAFGVVITVKQKAENMFKSRQLDKKDEEIKQVQSEREQFKSLVRNTISANQAIMDMVNSAYQNSKLDAKTKQTINEFWSKGRQSLDKQTVEALDEFTKEDESVVDQVADFVEDIATTVSTVQAGTSYLDKLKKQVNTSE